MTTEIPIHTQKLILDYLEAEECVQVMPIAFLQVSKVFMDLVDARTPFFVIYNQDYGGKSFSNEFYQLSKRIGKPNALKQLGSTRSGKENYPTCLGLASFPKKYEKGLVIDEYDGLETPRIDLGNDRVVLVFLSLIA